MSLLGPPFAGRRDGRGRLTGRHVLLLLAGFFGLVMLVNAAMTYLAVSTFSGIETENAYQRGLAYNERLLAAVAQESLGWQVTVVPKDLGDGRLAVTASFRDHRGDPVRDLDVLAELVRPTSRGWDQSATLDPQVAGRYYAELPLPLPGRWELRLRAARDGRDVYLLEQRL